MLKLLPLSVLAPVAALHSSPNSSKEPVAKLTMREKLPGLQVWQSFVATAPIVGSRRALRELSTGVHRTGTCCCQCRRRLFHQGLPYSKWRKFMSSPQGCESWSRATDSSRFPLHRPVFSFGRKCFWFSSCFLDGQGELLGFEIWVQCQNPSSGQIGPACSLSVPSLESRAMSCTLISINLIFLGVQAD